jgi:LmbE family N-acetylglucosaminyl deacetylase
MIERFKRVLVLGAHPDDEMGCAGLIYQLIQQGSYVEVYTFSRCEDLNGPELITEWQAALKGLGIDPRFADSADRPIVPQVYLMSYPNRRLPEYRQDILDALDIGHRRGFDLVLCPTTYDVHQDHGTVAAEARRAFKDTTILGYELPLNTVNGSTLTAFVGLSPEAMDAKYAHAYAFKSQREKSYMNERYIEGLARVRGLQCGTLWAEAFEVIRWVL